MCSATFSRRHRQRRRRSRQATGTRALATIDTDPQAGDGKRRIGSKSTRPGPARTTPRRRNARRAVAITAPFGRMASSNHPAETQCSTRGGDHNTIREHTAGSDVLLRSGATTLGVDALGRRSRDRDTVRDPRDRETDAIRPAGQASGTCGQLPAPTPGGAGTRLSQQPHRLQSATARPAPPTEASARRAQEAPGSASAEASTGRVAHAANPTSVDRKRPRPKAHWQTRARESRAELERTTSGTDRSIPFTEPPMQPTGLWREAVGPSLTTITLRQVWPRDCSLAAMCVRNVDDRVLQLTRRRAFCCVLHRPTSRVIHRSGWVFSTHD